MTDTLSVSARSERMSRIRSRNSKPELIVRRLVFSMGYRYRLHDRKLPGKPDLVFRSRHKVIFVHGCFWHRHGACRLARLPKSRLTFWQAKLEGNRVRDAQVLRQLAQMGWNVMIVWECETKKLDTLKEKILEFLV